MWHNPQANRYLFSLPILLLMLALPVQAIAVLQPAPFVSEVARTLEQSVKGIIESKLQGGISIGRRGAAAIRVVEQQGNIFEYLGRSARGEIRILAEVSREGNTLFLRKVHIEGLGSGSVGAGGLREFARQLGRQNRVREVVVEGARRTSGANQGRVQGSRMKQTQPPWALENYCLVENLWNSH